VLSRVGGGASGVVDRVGAGGASGGVLDRIGGTFVSRKKPPPSREEQAKKAAAAAAATAAEAKAEAAAAAAAIKSEKAAAVKAAQREKAAAAVAEEQAQKDFWSSSPAEIAAGRTALPAACLLLLRDRSDAHCTCLYCSLASVSHSSALFFCVLQH
jgi:hypothetical protein